VCPARNRRDAEVVLDPAHALIQAARGHHEVIQLDDRLVVRHGHGGRI